MKTRGVQTQNFKDQSRWNEACGKAYLEVFQQQPEKFIIDSQYLSQSRQIRQDLVQKISPTIKGKKILELGSGRGEFSIFLSKLGAIVTGIDLGADLVDLAGKISDFNKSNCQFVVGNICQLPFNKNEFDLVIGNAILHHLPEEGVIASLKETNRVLKPGGMALFTEPIENNKLFDFLQNLIPVGSPGTPYYRPSIIQRNKWKEYLLNLDDRPLTDKELINAKGDFQSVHISYYGFLSRFARLIPQAKNILEKTDSILTHQSSPIKQLAREVLITYHK
jgi:ubiquinone/menaquinone biosynthesis C-methylase UbiE